MINSYSFPIIVLLVSGILCCSCVKEQPIVSTTDVSGITSTSAVSGGTVEDNGGAEVTSRGVCWGTTQNPTFSASLTNDGAGNGTFKSNITGLTANTKYYVRAYATNSVGSAYGNEVSFISDKLTVTDADGNVYTTVTIGSQTWMKENLKTTKLNDNTYIPNILDITQWANTSSPAYCWYENQTYNKNIYGAIYNWYTVNTGKLCPAGWHVPSIGEWEILNNYVDYDPIKLKEQGYDHWECTQEGTNETGFTALPGGLRHSNEYYINVNGFKLIHKEIWFWSSSIPQGNPQSFFIYCSGTQSAHNDIYTDGRYVRCIKN